MAILADEAFTAGSQAGSSSTRVPSAAKWLGGLGAIPFVSLAVSIAVLDGALQTQAYAALAAYGAVILSFLGGINWGLAIAGNGAMPNALVRRLTLSVVPSLVGWAALLLPRTADLVVLAAAFGVMLLVDLESTRRGETPPWYPKLRWPLTVGVMSSLLLAACLFSKSSI